MSLPGLPVERGAFPSSYAAEIAFVEPLEVELCFDHEKIISDYAKARMRVLCRLGANFLKRVPILV